MVVAILHLLIITIIIRCLSAKQAEEVSSIKSLGSSVLESKTYKVCYRYSLIMR